VSKKQLLAWRPIDDCVPSYATFRKCGLALQLALFKHAQGTAAHGFALAATHLWGEIVLGMPDEVLLEWGRLAKLSEDELEGMVRAE
jgi:hypothetical protein